MSCNNEYVQKAHFGFFITLPSQADPSTREGCGRPLGMEFQPDGKLYVVDSFHGLYSIDVSSGKTDLIWDISHDVIGANKVGFPNYFAVLDNGSIIVTDTSERCSQMSIALSFVEFRAEGKVVLYNPSSKETHVILRNLSFPNGLLLSKDGSFIYIAETGRARILRLVVLTSHCAICGCVSVCVSVCVCVPVCMCQGVCVSGAPMHSTYTHTYAHTHTHTHSCRLP